MRWIITGGCGFIGRALATDLLARGGHQIRVLDNLSVGTRADLACVDPVQNLGSGQDDPNWTHSLALIEGDILDPSAVTVALAGADVVVHLAANTGVAPSVDNPMADCKTNVIGTLNVLEACRTHDIGRFVFASSGAPLGVQTPPLHEEMAPHPASPYGASKLAGEAYCSAYFHSFGVQTVALRFGNVYGEGSEKKASVVAKFIKEALAGTPLELYGDGSQTRDFIHISDLIGAIFNAATVEGIGGEVFQIATSSETTVSEMTNALLEIMEQEGLTRPIVTFGEKRVGDVARNFSDTRKALEKLNWKAEVTLGTGLRRTLRYFLNTNEA